MPTLEAPRIRRWVGHALACASVAALALLAFASSNQFPGGLIFTATGDDCTLHAYDKDTGQVLWEESLEANPDGIPSVYEVCGRQFVVFYAAATASSGSRTPMNIKPGKPEAQGYYAFAVPKRASVSKK
jgi:hypothetical protein